MKDRAASTAALRGVAGPLSAAAVMLAGCTFLIDFEEVPAPGDASELDSPVPPDAPDGRPDAATPTPDGGDAGADTGARDAIANPDACKGNPDRTYCPGIQLSWDGGNKDDLVTCKTSLVSNVRLCDMGVGCIAMIDGYPDECDQCSTKADGTYCGRDMPGWDARNANQRVRCQGGRQVGLLLCTTCKSMGTASVCQ